MAAAPQALAFHLDNRDVALTPLLVRYQHQSPNWCQHSRPKALLFASLSLPSAPQQSATNNPRRKPSEVAGALKAVQQQAAEQSEDAVGSADEEEGVVPLVSGKVYSERYRAEVPYGMSAWAEMWHAVDVVTGKPVLLKASRDGSELGYKIAARERDMTLAAQAQAAQAQAGAGTSGQQAAAEQHEQQERQQQQPVVRLFGSFDVKTASGNRHNCLVLEQLGDSLSHVMCHYLAGLGAGLPVPVVQQLTRRMVRALDYLHRERQLVHGDVVPDNWLLLAPFQTSLKVDPWEDAKLQAVNFCRGLFRQPPLESKLNEVPVGVISEYNLHRAKLKLVDFGRSWRMKDLNVFIPTEDAVDADMPGSRPPEEILGLACSPGYDMFQLGLMVWWLATGEPLFSPEPMSTRALAALAQSGSSQAAVEGTGMVARGGENATSRGAVTAADAASASGLERVYDINAMHLAAMASVLGRVPLEMVEASPCRSQYFKKNGRLKLESDVTIEPQSLQEILTETYHLSSDDATGLAAFITPLLQYDPTLRPEASELLHHPWLTQADAGRRQGAHSGGKKGWKALWEGRRGSRVREEQAAAGDGALHAQEELPFSEGFGSEDADDASAHALDLAGSQQRQSEVSDNRK